MGKNTFGKTMPRALSQNLKIMGEQIMLARKRRHLSMQDIADRATVTRLTVSKVEHGDPTQSMGIYARVLFALNLENLDITDLKTNNVTNMRSIFFNCISLKELDLYECPFVAASSW